MLNFKEKTKVTPSNFLFTELLGAPVSKQDWVNAIVRCAAGDRNLQCAMLEAFNLTKTILSPEAWLLVRKAAMALDPPAPEFIYRGSSSAMVFVCDNFVNAGACIRVGNLTEAAKWIMSGKDKKRAVMPKKPTGIRRKASLIIKFRERDDTTAWNKCK